jgi:capsule polysaccharide modification protein KpsS
MNILFVYSFTRLWNTFYEGLGSHRPVFATFRREFANELVSPLYVFSKKMKFSPLQKSILDEKELFNSFGFTRSLNLVHGNERQIIHLGKLYEQFYLDIFTKESIDCIVNWNLGYGFQHVGHLLAKKLGIKTLVMEGGLFRPYTLTVEPDGVNAFSMMRQWDGTNEIQVQDAATFQKFRNIYLADKENEHIHMSSLTSPQRSTMERFKKELKQRFVYNLFDTEIYHHHWLRRFFKTALRRVLADRSFVPPRGERVFIFFLSSVYDPQLDISTQDTITKHLRAVLDGFQLFRRNHPEFWLLIKEHPLDESRSLFWNLYKQNNKENVRWTIQSAKQLISISDGIITINSTVGIDALMLEKPVLCLGNSCYRHDGITILCSELFSAESIAVALEQLAIFRPDHRKVDLFLADAYKNTQIPVRQSSNDKEGIRHGLISYLEECSRHQ